MGWKIHEDGLKLDEGEEVHFDAQKVKKLVTKLSTAPNHPGGICEGILEILETGIVRSEVIFRLSKWCHWKNWSQYTARTIAAELFYGHIPRRFLDVQNEPKPSWEAAVKDYNEWRKAVVNKLPVTTPYPLESTNEKRSATWGSIRRKVSDISEQL